LIFLPCPASASSAELSSTSWITCSGLSVRVYMPGRCFTGSRPLSTRIEPSEYSGGDLVAMWCNIVRGHPQTTVNKTMSHTADRVPPARQAKRGNGYIPCMLTPHKNLSAAQILTCAAMIVTLSMGVRHGFGLWLQPITQAQNWTRETFSFRAGHPEPLLGRFWHLLRACWRTGLAPSAC
jgi:hypothetical protein